MWWLHCTTTMYLDAKDIASPLDPSLSPNVTSDSSSSWWVRRERPASVRPWLGTKVDGREKSKVTPLLPSSLSSSSPLPPLRGRSRTVSSHYLLVSAESPSLPRSDKKKAVITYVNHLGWAPPLLLLLLLHGQGRGAGRRGSSTVHSKGCGPSVRYGEEGIRAG